MYILITLLLQGSSPSSIVGSIGPQLRCVHVKKTQFCRVPAGHTTVHNRNNRSNHSHTLSHGTTVALGTLARVNSEKLIDISGIGYCFKHLFHKCL